MAINPTNMNSTAMADKRSELLLIFFIIAVVVSIGASYYRFVVLRDYPVQVQAPCDPSVERCFVYVCDPAYEECTGDPAVDTTYYKLLDRSAQHTPLCNPTEETCDVFVCPENEEGCTITLCEPETAEAEGVICSDPEEYREQHPPLIDEIEEEIKEGEATSEAS